MKKINKTPISLYISSSWIQLIFFHNISPKASDSWCSFKVLFLSVSVLRAFIWLLHVKMNWTHECCELNPITERSVIKLLLHAFGQVFKKDYSFLAVSAVWLKLNTVIILVDAKLSLWMPAYKQTCSDRDIFLYMLI